MLCAVRGHRSFSSFFRVGRASLCQNASSNEEGSFRRPFQLRSAEFYDEQKLEKEMRRVFDVCHGCRACFNLCESFPTLFDLVDKAETEELDSVPSSEFSKVVDDCTLCDMCFMVTCPYVPPHSLDIDFPHLIARYKIVEQAKKNKKLPAVLDEKEVFIWPNENENVEVLPGIDRSLLLAEANSLSMKHGMGGAAGWRNEIQTFFDKFLSDIDMIATVTTLIPSVVNGLLQPNSMFREKLEGLGIDKRAKLPPYVSMKNTLVNVAKETEISKFALRTSSKKVVLYGTCYSQYSKPDIGISAQRVLMRNGVDVKVLYETCCGMPQFEKGDIGAVEKQSRFLVKTFLPYIHQGYSIVSVVSSCSLMMKKEWPLLFPSKDVDLIAENTFDISEYVMKLSQEETLDTQVEDSFSASVSLHNACHSRAQNIGFKSREMLQLFKGKKMDVTVVQRCSGHGGVWGTRVGNFDKALKVGKVAVKQVAKQQKASKRSRHIVASDCPLAAEHLTNAMKLSNISPEPSPNLHPIEIVALAYGIHPSLNNNPPTPTALPTSPTLSTS